MRVLISGAGIAGLSLALCLRDRVDVECILVEKSPGLRGEGYMIDFFGPGYDAAERMGLLPELERIHYPIDRLAFLNPAGREKFAVSYPRMRRALHNRHFNFLRGDLERLLYPKVSGVRFGTTIASVRQSADRVEAVLSTGETLEADLLVGADGLHSHVRSLCFGDEARYFRYLDCNTAAYPIGRGPSLGNAFYTVTEPCRQAAIYPIRGGKLATFFIYTASEPPGRLSPEAAAAELKAAFRDMEWIVPELLKQLDPAGLYFDAVAQIEMPGWSAGRVVLLGDAAWCVSLLAGQGASMAMAGAEVLAEELRASDVASALAGYEKRLRPVIRKKQAAGRRMADWFLPRSSLRLALRDIATRIAMSPVGAPLLSRVIAP